MDGPTETSPGDLPGVLIGGVLIESYCEAVIPVGPRWPQVKLLSGGGDGESATLGERLAYLDCTIFVNVHINES